MFKASSFLLNSHNGGIYDRPSRVVSLESPPGFGEVRRQLLSWGYPKNAGWFIMENSTQNLDD